MKFVGIAGGARAGKNTLAGMLAGKLAHLGFTVKIDPLAKPIKHVTRNAGWRGAALGAWRDMHQAIAAALVSGNRCALADRLERRNPGDRSTDFVIVPDVRRPEEARRIRQRGLLVYLPGQREALTPDQAAHESESHRAALRDLADHIADVPRDLLAMEEQAAWLVQIILERYGW